MSVLSKEEIAAGLKAVPLFAVLDDRQIETLAQRAVVRRAEPGELLFSEGDPCMGLYVVVSGVVKIMKESAQGREQVLAIERKGGVVAELPVFDGGPYPASCMPLEPSLLLFISKQDFRLCCQQDPELALKVLASVGKRLRHLVGIIEELSFLTVRTRLAALLLQIAQEETRQKTKSPSSPGGKKREVISRQTSEPLRVPLRMTQQEMAARIGTVRELVSRNLSRLQAEGILRLEGHALIIADLSRLEQEALSQG
ncbi:MAG: Crp/Fnr family transcriptional regulator [Acidobacteria bacterium]|nr:Crp/Fnr family transcriptional regulator [Acidobacteriota bacterium]